jgi:hypothetical protein
MTAQLLPAWWGDVEALADVLVEAQRLAPAVADTPLPALDWAERFALLRTGDGRVLRFGEVGRDYQRDILADVSPRIVILKSRQIGISQTAAFLVAHEARYGGTAVVVSRTEDQAGLFLDYVYTALGGDPDCPGFVSENMFSLELANGGRALTQPASRSSGRGIAATLVVIDEMAWQLYAQQIYTSVLPMLSETGGRLVVLSTPNGQGDQFHQLWQAAQIDGSPWSPHLLPWQVHPVWRDTPGWREERLDELGEVGFAQEHDCDFVASGAAVFDPDEIAKLWRMPALLAPQRDHRYVTGWDIARRRDAFVGATIDVSTSPFQLAAFNRQLHIPYPVQASTIETRHKAYQGTTVVESNGVGDPLIEFLTIAVDPFTTSALTKRQAVDALKLLIQREELIAPDVPETQQLKRELLMYQWDDKNLMQDCVMALAIAALKAGRPVRRRPTRWDGTVQYAP